ncbi:MAG: ATP-binding cassette domain-containing protein [Fimbriimonadales bacterium]
MALSLRNLVLRRDQSPISLVVEPGQTLCVVGPAASGKSKLLRIIGGQEAAEVGEVVRPGKVSIPTACNRKLRPQNLSHKKGANRALLATEVLSQLGLWEVRQRPMAELAPAQVAACDLVETFMSGADLLLFDEHLDRLDPCVRVEAVRLIRSRGNRGAIAVVATNHLEMASQFDFLVVLKDGRPLYVGSISELMRTRAQRSLTVESERSRGARALVGPLLVAVTGTEGGYVFTPGPGQEHAAQLLRDGYGDVKFVVSDQRSLAEIILGMIVSG